MSISKIKKEIIILLSPISQFIYLFGSIIHDSRFTQKSDIDIALYTSKKLKGIEKLELKQKIESILRRDVDLIFLNTSDIIITMQVLMNGQIIYNKNKQEHLRYTLAKESEYMDFKNYRKELEENMLKV